MTPGRRAIAFSSLDDVVPEAERLLDGYQAVGNWSLAQVCRHLANTFRKTSVTPPDLDLEATITPEQSEARSVLDHGRLPEGIPMRDPKASPPEGLDAQAEIIALREAIGLFLGSPGPGPAHPRLGPLTKDEWIRFHCIHCAHHFSFLIPQSGVQHA